MTDALDAVTVTLSPRDVQWVCAALGTVTTLLHPCATSDEIETNIASLCQLLIEEYSGTEANDIAHRFRAVLPLDTMLRFDNRDGAFSPSTSTLIQ